MPELPEVETVRKTLELRLNQEIITDVVICYDKIIKTNLIKFVDQIKNQKINRIDRMGKYLIFILDFDALIIHLRMEGKFFIKDSNEQINKHEHIIFKFKSNIELRYHDVRKFGTMHLIPLTNYLNEYPINELALEPKDISLELFYKKIKSRNTEIKPVLLDQKVIAGLGNIYVDETLFLSKINPKRLASNITYEEAKMILDSAIKVLDKATLLGGTTIRSYTSSLGVTGLFQNELNCHMRENEPCYICREKIIKFKLKGRGTYVCPSCQK
jgi:formamidopyrimidine-DNA glycosylase